METVIEISVRNNNLYRTGTLLFFPVEGEYALVREKIKDYKGTLDDHYHTVTVNDRLDIIAWKFWGDIVEDASKYWWVLADVNNVYDPFDLNEWVGKKMLVPDILNIFLEL